MRIGREKGCTPWNKGLTKETDIRIKKNAISCSGKLNHNYNHNITDEERQVGRNYPEYKEWRQVVYKRDSYICQICGKEGGNLNAHHLEGYTDNPELRTTLSNGITLCEKCHKDFHHQYGRGNNTGDQMEEFLERKNEEEE